MSRYYDYIDEKELIKIVSDSVKIPSINPPGDEEKMCKYVIELLEKNHIDYQVVPVQGSRYDILAKIKGKTDKDAIVFTGHMDVVPVSGDERQRWTTDPFSATIEGGYLYGRGSTDMKGGLMSALYAMILLKRYDIVPRRDVLLAATVDEENYMKGSKALMGNVSFKNAKHLVVCEPTDLAICNQQKGRTWANVDVHGKTGHGSQKDTGGNAIYLAINLIEKIKNSKFENYPDSFWRTLAIKAGVEPQVVPDICTFTVDARLQVGHRPDEIWEKLDLLISNIKAENPAFNATYKVVDKRESWYTSHKDKLILDIKASLEGMGIEAKFETFQGSTDASKLIKNGLTCVIIGPGDLSRAHKEDERVKISQLYSACRLYMDMMLAQ